MLEIENCSQLESFCKHVRKSNGRTITYSSAKELFVNGVKFEVDEYKNPSKYRVYSLLKYNKKSRKYIIYSSHPCGDNDICVSSSGERTILRMFPVSERKNDYYSWKSIDGRFSNIMIYKNHQEYATCSFRTCIVDGKNTAVLIKLDSDESFDAEGVVETMKSYCCSFLGVEWLMICDDVLDASSMEHEYSIIEYRTKRIPYFLY